MQLDHTGAPTLSCFRCFPPIEARPLNYLWGDVKHYHGDSGRTKVTSCQMFCPDHIRQDSACPLCQDCSILRAKMENLPDNYERVACGMSWCVWCPRPRPGRRWCWGCDEMYLVTEGKRCRCVQNK